MTATRLITAVISSIITRILMLMRGVYLPPAVYAPRRFRNSAFAKNEVNHTYIAPGPGMRPPSSGTPSLQLVPSATNKSVLTKEIKMTDCRNVARLFY